MDSPIVSSLPEGGDLRKDKPHAPPQQWDGEHMPFTALQRPDPSTDDDSFDGDDNISVGGMSTAGDIREQAEAMSQEARAGLVDRIKRFASRHGLRARTVNVDWPDDDLEDEMRRLENEVALQRSLKFQRRMLLTFTAGCEYIHTKTPLNGRLDGWGETILSQIDDYDDVFERLPETHAPKLGVAGVGQAEETEIQLLRMLAYSAFTHAVTTSIAKMSMSANTVEQRKEQAAIRMQKSAVDTKSFIHATTKPATGGNKQSTKRTVKLS